MNSPDDWMQALVRHAKALRAAGVTRMKLEGCEVELAPAPATDAKPSPDHDEEFSDPLDDPATFGLGNGRVPGYRRREAE